MKPLTIHNRIMGWFDRWTGGPLNWVGDIAVSLVTVPLSLIVWFLVDLRDAKKDRARMREDIKGGTQ